MDGILLYSSHLAGANEITREGEVGKLETAGCSVLGVLVYNVSGYDVGSHKRRVLLSPRSTDGHSIGTQTVGCRAGPIWTPDWASGISCNAYYQ